jgi:hypothetical protein
MSAKSCLGEWNAAPQQQGFRPPLPDTPIRLRRPSFRRSGEGRTDGDEVLVMAGPHYLTLVTVEVDASRTWTRRVKELSPHGQGHLALGTLLSSSA